MKKYLLIGIVALFASSCSEDTMDAINKDTQNPPAGTVSAKFQLTDAIMATAFTTTSGQYAWSTSSYTEQEFGCGDNQLANTELREIVEITSSTTFNNEWNGTYSNLQNIKQMIGKCSEGGLNSGQYDILGMAQLLYAINFGILTDLHGDIPCSEALQGVALRQPKLDKQEDIYNNTIFKSLDSSIENLTKAKNNKLDNALAQDILFSNNKAQANGKWLASAYAVKARYLMHTYAVNNAVLADVIVAANAAIAEGFNGMNLSVFNGVNTDNPWTAYFWSRYYTGTTTTVVKLMEDRNDSRVNVYNVDMFEGNTVGIPGNAAQASSTQVINAPAWLNEGAASVQIMSKAELYFILAEAQARLGQDASAAFATAVEASYKDYGTFGEVDSATDYIASLAGRYSANPLAEIMVQKYLSQCRDGQIEAYNDIRRCKALGESFITLSNPLNNQAGANRWPERLPYGNSDVNSNLNVKAAYGDGSYVLTEKVWWAGGTR